MGQLENLPFSTGRTQEHWLHQAREEKELDSPPLPIPSNSISTGHLKATLGLQVMEESSEIILEIRFSFTLALTDGIQTIQRNWRDSGKELFMHKGIPSSL